MSLQSDGTTTPYSTSKELVVQYEGTVMSSTSSSIYHVVVDSVDGSSTSGATFSYSRNGASFSAAVAGAGETGQDIVAAGSSASNTELGNGLKLLFAGTQTYAVGQAW